MKKEQITKKDTEKRMGCLPFLMVIAIIVVFIFVGKNGVKKDFNYLMRGEADIKNFIFEIKEAYEKNMTYPDFSLPLSGNITSPFGKRMHPIKNTEEMHTGIDIDLSGGSDVKAAESGEAVKLGNDIAYGNYIIIKHKGSYSTCYAHLDGFNISEGEYIEKGESIGTAGSSGQVTGPHLHFEIRKGEERVDPMKYLVGNGENNILINEDDKKKEN